MPSIQVRALSATGDPLRGNGIQNFLFDLAAVTQLIQTTLLLLLGEYFPDLTQGTPLFQNLIGVPSTANGVALILRQRIMGVPFVTGIQNLSVVYGAGRTCSFSCDVLTAFGTVTISTPALPGSQAALTTQ